MVYRHVSFWGVPWVSNPLKKITFTKQIQRETVTRCSKQNRVTRCSFWQGSFSTENLAYQKKTQSFPATFANQVQQNFFGRIVAHVFVSNDLLSNHHQTKERFSNFAATKVQGFPSEKNPSGNSSLQKTLLTANQ